ncbi:S-adenosyl-L-methionine-dependent methyltransferase, partial [Aspergillus violaceofuscus CBS 115571]
LTNSSNYILSEARDRFQQQHNMEFDLLDITRDPIPQGLREGRYDLVIATNVFHATPNLRETLQHVRKLLAPGGYLLFQELCPGR